MRTGAIGVLGAAESRDAKGPAGSGEQSGSDPAGRSIRGGIARRHAEPAHRIENVDARLSGARLGSRSDAVRALLEGNPST
jgi:hypothetical protein